MAARSISAVRVRDLPAEFARLGVVAWNGPQAVDVLGCRVVDALGGPSGDGLGISTLTIVQERSRPVLDASMVSKIRDWAECWLSGIK